VCVAAEGREPFLFAPLIEEREKVLKPPKKNISEERITFSCKIILSLGTLIKRSRHHQHIIIVLLLKRR
jgi:hypothetical protein